MSNRKKKRLSNSQKEKLKKYKAAIDQHNTFFTHSTANKSATFIPSICDLTRTEPLFSIHKEQGRVQIETINGNSTDNVVRQILKLTKAEDP